MKVIVFMENNEEIKMLSNVLVPCDVNLKLWKDHIETRVSWLGDVFSAVKGQ
jgi:hypothetical protein